MVKAHSTTMHAFSRFMVISSFFSSLLLAQTPAMVQWSCMPPDSQHVSATSGNVQGYDQSSSPGFVVRDYNNGPGPDQRWWPYADGAAVPWGDETAQVDSRYVQFEVSPNPGFTCLIDTIQMYLGAKGTSNLRANVVIALDPDFNVNMALNTEPIALVNDSDEWMQWGISVQVPENETFYVRIYPWYLGAPSTSKYLYVRGVTISGSSQGVQADAAATWDLTNPDQGGTGSTVELIGPLGGVDQDLTGLVIEGYTGVDESQMLNIETNLWPAGFTWHFSVNSSFSISPQPGQQFTATQISLKLSATGTENMKASLKYSTEVDFANPVIIPFTTSDPSGNDYLLQDSLQTITHDLNATISPGSSFDFRIYPWVDNQPEAVSNAYILLQSVEITGMSETVPIVDPPTVSTENVEYISTTSVMCGGNVSSDGGAPVTLRGVCWNTSGSPLYTESHTEDGSGGGAFQSQVAGLTPNTTYYLRAYAVNDADGAYGVERVFTTLEAIVPPGVGTFNVSDILVNTAECGGSVYDWGGAPVLARGVCWNTYGEPTLEDDHSDDGVGQGPFSSLLTGLLAETTYFVRAYATNQAGTAYGNEVSFTTQLPAPAVHKIVAQDGSGDYLTVQEAFDDVPDYYTGTYTISVTAGIYYEKLMLEREKINVILRGESAETTILTYDDYAGIAGGTSQSYSVAIDADDFIAANITFQNTVQNDGSVGDQQGVALRVNGDRQGYYNCRLLGYQDTYYTWGGRGTGRIYMKDCYIEGSVDFIFGRDIVVFDSCEIHINRNGGTLTAASTEFESSFGYVFKDCDITAAELGFDGNPITSFFLGRPWQAAPRTVFLRCTEPATLSAAGWASWNVAPALYAEYMCTGPGSDTSLRHTISRQLSDEEASLYTLENIFSRESNLDLGYDWLPPITVDVVQVDPLNQIRPTSYSLAQNFPNPFNPSTSIQYSLAGNSRVELTLYDVRGRLVKVLVDGEMDAGVYRLTLQGDDLSSGVYLYQLKTSSFTQTRKMILLK